MPGQAKPDHKGFFQGLSQWQLSMCDCIDPGGGGGHSGPTTAGPHGAVTAEQHTQNTQLRNPS